jgi:hypothetical protein
MAVIIWVYTSTGRRGVEAWKTEKGPIVSGKKEASGKGSCAWKLEGDEVMWAC